MPNNITTAVEIMGSKAQISKLIKKTKIKLEKDVDNEFDFNGIIPMPKELQIQSGSQTDLGMAALGDEKQFAFYKGCSWFADRYPGVETPEQLEAFLKKPTGDEKTDASNAEVLEFGKQAFINLKKYKFKDWYDWSAANWGTKWNAYDVHYLNHDDNHLLLEITTAWDTPHEIWNALELQGYEVNGTYYGEMEGTDTIGNGGPFYVNVSVDYENDMSDYGGTDESN